VVGALATAFAAGGVMEEATAMGVRGILPKPVNVEALLALVEPIIGCTD
jgi:hypothetical protein